MHLHTNTFAVELKTEDLSSKGEFSGYGAIFNTPDQGNDIIQPGAFDKTLKEGKMPKMLWNHDPREPIGVWTSVKTDARGLLVEGRLLTGVRKGAEVKELLEAKALDGLSIGYQTVSSEALTIDGRRFRSLTELKLWEVSVVAFPMHMDATVTDVKQLGSVREVETLLRENGVPGNFAKLVAAHGYPEACKRLKLDLRDDDESDNELLQRVLSELNQLKETIHG